MKSDAEGDVGDHSRHQQHDADDSRVGIDFELGAEQRDNTYCFHPQRRVCPHIHFSKESGVYRALPVMVVDSMLKLIDVCEVGLELLQDAQCARLMHLPRPSRPSAQCILGPRPVLNESQLQHVLAASSVHTFFRQLDGHRLWR